VCACQHSAPARVCGRIHLSKSLHVLLAKYHCLNVTVFQSRPWLGMYYSDAVGRRAVSVSMYNSKSRLPNVISPRAQCHGTACQKVGTVMNNLCSEYGVLHKHATTVKTCTVTVAWFTFAIMRNKLYAQCNDRLCRGSQTLRSQTHLVFRPSYMKNTEVVRSTSTQMLSHYPFSL
jgi:hypothetical protein